MQRELHIKYNYIWISIYRWTCIWAPYIHVAYVLSDATECHVQLVLCNYTNLQLHVLHATEFQLQTTIAKPKISSSDMISHNCTINNTFHMIKHDANILQIPCKLHSCDKVDSIPDIIYQHLKNKHLLSQNLSLEAILLDVVIMTIGLQFKVVMNISTSWMTLERCNKVMNVMRVKFTKFVLNVLQLFTFEEFHHAITKIIKQVIHQKGLASIEGNCKKLCIKCVIHLLYDQFSSLLYRLSTLSIHNKMVMNTKMNCHS